MMKRAFLVILSLLLLTSCTSKDELVTDHENKPSERAESDIVVSINGKDYTNEQLNFYKLMSIYIVELSRDKELASSDEREHDHINDYWDEQLETYNNVNVNLQNLIELNAMALLGEEKGYEADEETIQSRLKEFNDKITGLSSSIIVESRKEFSDLAYDELLRDYVKLDILNGKVIEHLSDRIKEEKKDINDEELKYELREQYEQLYLDQVKSLNIEIEQN